MFFFYFFIFLFLFFSHHGNDLIKVDKDNKDYNVDGKEDGVDEHKENKDCRKRKHKCNDGDASKQFKSLSDVAVGKRKYKSDHVT